MTQSATYYSEPRADRIVVQFFGVLDRLAVSDALDIAERKYLADKQFGRCVQFDLGGVTDYEESARAPLLALHKFWSLRSSRSAYVACVPRVRGLALWVIHTAEDQNAKVLMSPNQVAPWFGSRDGRVQDARRRTLSFVEQVQTSLGALGRRGVT